MIFYLIILILIIIIVIGLIFWFYKIIMFFKNSQIKKGLIQLSVLLFLLLFLTWEFRILPISLNNDFKNKTEDLTGKKFWSWNIYRFEDFGFRDGYIIETYRLNDEVAKSFEQPNQEFFTKYPNKNIGKTKWKKTPLKLEDLEDYEFVTPIYGSWSEKRQKEVKYQYNLINKIIKEEGAYYFLEKTNQTDFYLISPKYKIMVWINHDM